MKSKIANIIEGIIYALSVFVFSHHLIVGIKEVNYLNIGGAFIFLVLSIINIFYYMKENKRRK